MKNVSRNKFLLCFRPVVDMDDQLLLDSRTAVNGSNTQSLTIVGIGKKEEVKNNSRFNNSSLLLNNNNNNNRCSSSTISAENSLIFHSPTRKTSFSRAIKAVLFEIILSKRVREERRGSSQDLYKSKHNLLNKSEDIKLNLVPCSSCSSSLESCSSCSSSVSEPNNVSKSLSSTNSNSMRPNKDESYVIYLVLFSLTVTLFWGKLCAILFTSIWLYLLPRRQDVLDKFECRKKRAKSLKEKDHI